MSFAVAGEIITTKPIPGADRIQSATVRCGNEGTWNGVVQKTIHVGDIVTVFLPDAVLPEGDARWEFMKNHKYRVKMSKFKGFPSECLILDLGDSDAPGTDLTARYGVTKYEKTIEPSLRSPRVTNLLFAFPSFLPKTDEPNVQRVLEWSDLTRSSPWYVTEKIDGSSCTAWKGDDGELHVASRNWELAETVGCLYWDACKKYDLKNNLPNDTAIQFEVCGPKLQGNPMGLSSVEGRAFTVFSHSVQQPFDALVAISNVIGMPMVRVLHEGSGEMDLEWVHELADGMRYENGKKGEGVVVRAKDQSYSFKVLSRNYKESTTKSI